MKPFSALKFIIENKRKGIMTFLVLILAVCAIALVTVLTDSIYESVDQTYLRQYKEFSIVYPAPGDLYLNASVVELLQKNTDIEKLVPCDAENTMISLAMGNSSVTGIFAGQEDVSYYLGKIGDTLKDGRLPENGTNEIAVHWRVLANKHWEIGQSVGSDIDPDESLAGTYKIVGVLDGESIAFVGTQTNRERTYIKNNLDISKPVAYAVFPKEGKQDAVNRVIDGINRKDAGSETLTKMTTMINKQLASLNSTIVSLLLIMIIIISISSGALMYLVYLQRSDEFGILVAMGYRKGFIYRLILKEVLALDVLSWAVGFILAYFMVLLLNKAVYLPQGNVLNFFNIKVLVYTFCIPVMVAVFSILPIIMKLRRQDPITTIERRD
ncbi:ABC transporter permease [Oscillospiraceae bacterium WX1]